MDDYATIVDRQSLKAGKLIPAGKPYWATRSPDGKSCVISESETDVVTVIDFATGEKSAVCQWESPTASAFGLCTKRLVDAVIFKPIITGKAC